jgi:hypothetical protein
VVVSAEPKRFNDPKSMIRYFEIKKVRLHHNRPTLILAKHLGTEHDFIVPDGSMLDDLKVEIYVPMLTAFREEGVMDMFAFQPYEIENYFYKSFQEGQIVELITP